MQNTVREARRKRLDKEDLEKQSTTRYAEECGKCITRKATVEEMNEINKKPKQSMSKEELVVAYKLLQKQLETGLHNAYLKGLSHGTKTFAQVVLDKIKSGATTEEIIDYCKRTTDMKEIKNKKFKFRK